MNILVTGCYGFIGYNFINFLIKKYGNDVQIVGVDSLTSEFSKYNSVHEKRINFIEADINNISTIEHGDLKDIDTIVNFAAESHVDTSIYNPEVFLKSNIIGLSRLIKFGIDNNITNFLHVSTDEVYGSLKSNFALEDDKLNPSSPYSASKASAELIASSFSKTFGFEIKMVRPANNYGFYQQPEKLIPYSIANLLSGKQIEIYGNGKHIRHWLHVEDTCSAIDKVLQKGLPNTTYNIGSGVYLENIEVAKKILSIMNFDETMLTYIEDRPGHDFRYAVNFDSLKNLGWKPSEDFDDLLDRTISWYSSNKMWWENGFHQIVKNRKKRFSLDE